MCFILIVNLFSSLNSFFFFISAIVVNLLNFWSNSLNKKAYSALKDPNSDLYLTIRYASIYRFKFFFIKKYLFTLNFYYLLDYFFINLFYFSRQFSNKSRILFRLKQINSLNYFKTSESKNQNKDSFLFLNSLFFAYKSIWRLVRFWILGLILFLFAFYYLTYIRLLPFNKVLFEWFVLIMFIYWLLSGFVFFFKKYQFSKYTSVIQRFWKRSYILFWLIESATFLVFFYLTLNSSSEPVYMYDQMKLYKTHMFSWRLFILKLIPGLSLIVIGYLLQLKLKWSQFGKSTLFVLVITVLLLYVLWLEFYQFFHIISGNGHLLWVFNHDEMIWSVEQEFKKNRLANNYIAVCLIAKFWHLVFIFVFWVFFVLRVNESNRIRYPLFSANCQNFVILYIMSWLYMYPWLKFYFRGFLDSSYYWFYTNVRTVGFRVFVNDLYTFFYNLLSLSWLHSSLDFNFESYPFFYWIESSEQTNFLQFKKHALRDQIIQSLKTN